MGNGALLIQLMLNSGLAQYPDKSLYNAAKLLAPEERPSVPVKVTHEPWRQGQGVEATFFGFHPKYAADGPKIGVQRRGQAYKQFDKYPNRLAAVLAHEAKHDRGANEAEAYQRQYDVLQRLGETDKNFLKAMSERIATERTKETAPTEPEKR